MNIFIEYDKRVWFYDQSPTVEYINGKVILKENSIFNDGPDGEVVGTFKVIILNRHINDDDYIEYIESGIDSVGVHYSIFKDDNPFEFRDYITRKLKNEGYQEEDINFLSYYTVLDELEIFPKKFDPRKQMGVKITELLAKEFSMQYGPLIALRLGSRHDKYIRKDGSFRRELIPIFEKYWEKSGFIRTPNFKDEVMIWNGY